MLKRTLFTQVKNFLFFVVFLSLAGCASTMPQLKEPIEKSRTFSAPFDEVWNAAISALTTSNQMMSLTEKDSGVIGVNRQFTKQEIWSYVLADSWTKTFTTWTSFGSKANLILQKVDPGQTKVTINTQIFGGEKKIDYNIWFGYATSSNQERGLTSNGKLEKEYLDMIEAQIPNLRKMPWLESDDKNKELAAKTKQSKPAEKPAGENIPS